MKTAVGLLFLLASLASSRASTAQAPTPQVLVVPIRNVIDETTVALFERALREARSHGVSRVVLDIDTPGGMLWATKDIETILTSMADGGVSTTAFVAHHALSAGGYLALAAERTFMAKGATIGAIMPVIMGPEGISQIPDDDARKKLYSAMKADLRAMIKRRKGMPTWASTVVQAMVDPRMRVYRVSYADPTGLEKTDVLEEGAIAELESAGNKILNREEIGGGTYPLTLTADEAEDLSFSAGTVASIEELVHDVFDLPPEAIGRMEPSWSEEMVKWITGMKPFLFVLGFILLLIEMKTPGFAVPGVLGLLLLGLAMFGSYLVGVAAWTEILLFFLGLGLIAVEIFVLPGTIVFGFLGFLCVVFGLVLSQQPFVLPHTPAQHSILQSNLQDMLLVLVLVIFGSITLWKIMPYLPLVRRILLPAPKMVTTGASTQFGDLRHPVEPASLIGRTGEARTDLRPAGIMVAGEDRLDVVSEGGFLVRGTRVRIIKVVGNRIVVEPIPSPTESGAASVGVLTLLLFVGLGLVIAEIFFVSFGILSIGAAVSLVSAVFLAFTQHGQTAGFLMLAAAALGVPLTIYFTLKWLPGTRLGKSLILSGTQLEMASAGQAPGLDRFLGKSGEAISALRPAGIARIDDQRVDVITRGEMLAEGSPLKVIEVEGNRVVVALHEQVRNENPGPT